MFDGNGNVIVREKKPAFSVVSIWILLPRLWNVRTRMHKIIGLNVIKWAALKLFESLGNCFAVSMSSTNCKNDRSTKNKN